MSIWKELKRWANTAPGQKRNRPMSSYKLPAKTKAKRKR